MKKEAHQSQKRKMKYVKWSLGTSFKEWTCQHASSITIGTIAPLIGNKELQMMKWKLVVQRWHFGNGIGVVDKRRKEQMRAMSGRRRSLGV